MARRLKARAIRWDQGSTERHHRHRLMDTPHQQIEDMAASQQRSKAQPTELANRALPRQGRKRDITNSTRSYIEQLRKDRSCAHVVREAALSFAVPLLSLAVCEQSSRLTPIRLNLGSSRIESTSRSLSSAHLIKCPSRSP